MNLKARELRELNLVELQEKEREAREEIFHARMKAATGELDNTSKLRADRKYLARVLTTITQKKRAEAK
jgi:large subunit ribosomal protein L29